MVNWKKFPECENSDSNFHIPSSITKYIQKNFFKEENMGVNFKRTVVVVYLKLS